MPATNWRLMRPYRHLVACMRRPWRAKMRPRIQEEMQDQLAKFAQAYPKADDTPYALELLRWEEGRVPVTMCPDSTHPLAAQRPRAPQSAWELDRPDQWH